MVYPDSVNNTYKLVTGGDESDTLIITIPVLEWGDTVSVVPAFSITSYNQYLSGMNYTGIN